MTEKRPSKKTTTVENQVKFSFRVPGDLYEKLEKDAIRNGRSINYQLIWVLKEHYDGDSSSAATPPQA